MLSVGLNLKESDKTIAGRSTEDISIQSTKNQEVALRNGQVFCQGLCLSTWTWSSQQPCDVKPLTRNFRRALERLSWKVSSREPHSQEGSQSHLTPKPGTSSIRPTHADGSPAPREAPASVVRWQLGRGALDGGLVCALLLHLVCTRLRASAEPGAHSSCLLFRSEREAGLLHRGRKERTSVGRFLTASKGDFQQSLTLPLLASPGSCW